MNTPATPKRKRSFEEKTWEYIGNNYGKCWALVILVCAVGVMWRRSWG